METREVTSESHTAEWIASYVQRVATEVDVSRFSGICSDSTGNTLAARRLLCTKILPVALNLADCCHHLNRTILDLTKIPEFELAIKIVRKTVATFHSSHFGFTALKAARERHHTGRGLEAIGKTRFAMIVLSAMSVQRSLVAIKDVIKLAPDGMFEANYYQSTPSQATFDFESHLAQLIHATYPATKALACLEALETTAADVYIFWHAVICATEEALINKKNRFLPDTVDAVQQVLYTRHNQLFGSGNLANDVYLAATYLN
ncbi:hypothetical protein BGW80DRAFT_1169990 [Lactifluus volemus]|nr:hypothetical protein BGW80DRAFT_1169990 [Lactifluus volemus]